MSSIQKSALINEYKGNLFEFLLAQRLAQYFKLESSFLQTLPLAFRERLAFYEDYLLQNDRELFKRLPRLVEEIFPSLVQRLPSEALAVFLVGKISGQGEREEWGEADILIKNQKRDYKISLKLCKEHAFVNTKSAGLKSFIEKYFSAFPESLGDQKLLNEKVEKDFYKMAHCLYEKVGLDFKGHFDSSWTEAGLSELPGQLSEELSPFVLKYYSEQALFLREILYKYFQSNPSLFCRSLYPLLGIADEQILQVICFHGTKDHEKHLLKQISLMEMKDLDDELQDVKLGQADEGKSSFELQLKKIILQIRCKPMNKFTVPALKINCSMKKG